MKKCTSRGIILAAAAGLAMSATASAQYAIVNNVSGTFVDISSTGTPIAAAGDDTLHTFTSTVGNAVFPAGTVTVGSNGWMCAGAYAGTFAPYGNVAVPSTGMPAGSFTASNAQGYLLPFWDDLDARPGGAGTSNTTIFWQEIGGVLIVQWHNIGHYVNAAGQTVDFEVKVFGTPSGGTYAQYLYADTVFGGAYGADNGLSATIGYLNDANASANNMQYSFNTASIQSGAVLSIIVDTSTGACCLPSYTCVPGISGAACTAQGGVYQGANSQCSICPLPPVPGACCLPGGSCSVILAAACFTQNGVFNGEGVACAATNCSTLQYSYDDGTMENALGPTATGGVAFANQFASVAGQDKITRIEIAFGVYAALNGLPITVVLESDPDGDGTPNDAQVLAQVTGVIIGANAVFSPTPNWVAFDIPDTIIPVGQKFFAGFIVQNSPAGQFPGAFDTATAAGHSWWGYSAGAFDPNAWVGYAELTALGFPGNWLIRADAIAAGPACYANCDSSTIIPCLNVQDFGCFLNRFASGDTYANCDNSTIVPVLNVQDFTCFLNSFASGCSGC